MNGQNKMIKSEISKWPLLKDLTIEESSLILPWISEKNYKESEVILKQGTHDNYLYLIIEGHVSVNLTLPDGRVKKATILQKGDTFGEVSFLAENPITATLKSEEKTRCIVIHKNLLKILEMTYPEIAYKTEKSIVYHALQKIIPGCERMYHFLFKIKPESNYLISKDKFKNDPKSISVNDIPFEFLNTMPCFKKMSKKEINKILNFAEAYEFKKGYFLKDSFQDKSIYIVCSGAIMLFVGERETFLKMLSVYGIGGLFPSSWPSESKLCHMACENTTVLKISEENALLLKKKLPFQFYEISHHFHKEIVNMIYVLNRQFARINMEYRDYIDDEVKHVQSTALYGKT